MPRPELGELRAYQKGQYPWDSPEYDDQASLAQQERVIISEEKTILTPVIGKGGRIIKASRGQRQNHI